MRQRRGLYILLLTMIVLVATMTLVEAAPSSSEVVLSKVSFFKADLVAVLQQLSAECGYNVIITPEVSGAVTIQLTNVTFEEALKFILQAQGLIYKREGSNFFIGKPGQFFGDQQKSIGYFHIYYGDTKQIGETLKKFFPRADVLADERTQTIIVNAPKETNDEIAALVRNLDQKMRQLTIDVKIIEVSISALRKLGVNWNIDGTGGTGLNWGLETSSGSELILRMIDAGHAWSFIFKNLSSDGSVRLVTAPSVSTIDGKEASILIGDKIPVIKEITETTISRTATIEYIDVGVKLIFTPRIQQNDEVTIALKTQVNTLGEKDPTTGYYIIGAREVSTNVQAKLNETVFIGGLISQEEREKLMKIPILGNIFVIGTLFRHKEKVKTETELIITITPRWTTSINLANPMLKNETTQPKR
jgi:type II secretory pathway component GspD/PulD (secretin)